MAATEMMREEDRNCELLLHEGYESTTSKSLTINPRGLTEARVDKIPPELRRHGGRYRRNHDRFLHRLKHDSQTQRSIVQAAFILICIWIGIEFHYFMRWGLSKGAEHFIARPPGVEGFLPISALISLKYWITTGVINAIHPSGLFILLAILGGAFLFKKAFCGWLCPIGTLSESLWMLGEKLFGRNAGIPKWLDYPLRSLKYLLLYFFANVIWQMDTSALRTFIDSPYNKMADVKMYLFFANISTFALWAIIILALLSVVVKNFWCRYLCPYGALLGMFSVISPFKITRREATCIDCELCTKVCPASIKVHRAARVWSDECMACYKCIEACPVKGALEMRSPGNGRPVPSWVFAALVIGIFVGITGLAMIGGSWNNSIGKSEYLGRFQELDTPAYDHFGSGGGNGGVVR